METVERGEQSRRRRRKSNRKKEIRNVHFRTVCIGGFEEGQVLCYLWDIVKTLEAGKEKAPPEERLEKQLRMRVRVEMRRYFTRRKRRNGRFAAGMLCIVLFTGWLFGYQIGVDRVAGTSMYPYLNNGDWIIYSRRGKEIKRDDVVVFEKSGESMVKRVAGLPGDCVEFNRTGSRVVVNGVQIDGEYVTLTLGEGKTEDPLGAPQIVMNGQYLVLGDNRAESVDSRDRNVGTVPAVDVLGKVIWIVRDGR